MREVLTSRDIGSLSPLTFFLADQNIPTGMNTVYYSLFQTGGRRGIETHGDGVVPEPFFQLVVRHGKYIDAMHAAEEAWKILTAPETKITNEVVGDKFFLWVSPLTPPFTLSADDQQRSRVAFNLGTSVRDVVAT